MTECNSIVLSYQNSVITPKVSKPLLNALRHKHVMRLYCWQPPKKNFSRAAGQSKRTHLH